MSRASKVLGFEIQTEQLWPLHMIISLHFKQLSGLTVGKGFGYCELILAAVDFYEIEFILLYTPLIFGYMSIGFVLSLNLMVSNIICHSCPNPVSSSSQAPRPCWLYGSQLVAFKSAAFALPISLLEI